MLYANTVQVLKSWVSIFVVSLYINTYSFCQKDRLHLMEMSSFFTLALTPHGAFRSRYALLTLAHMLAHGSYWKAVTPAADAMGQRCTDVTRKRGILISSVLFFCAQYSAPQGWLRYWDFPMEPCNLHSILSKPKTPQIETKKETEKEQKNRVAASHKQYSEMVTTVKAPGCFLNSSDSCLQVIPRVSGKPYENEAGWPVWI